MKAVILTEGGTDIGFGHIYRCAAITHGLRKRSIECTLIINGDSSLQNLDIGTDFSINNWMLDIDNIKNLYGDTVIIDSYKADKNLVKKVAALFKLSVYIDDYKRMIYPSGIVINSAIGADHLNYPDISGVEYLLGLKYHPMRMEFWECEKKSINRQVNNILITIGGSDMKNIMNLKIKRRESFRPFAPSIHMEATSEYFEIDYPDPFMMKVYKIRPEKRDLIPAVTHVDGTGRLQTVRKKDNPLYWQLIDEFRKITGIPIVLNTSFNENDPIVCKPEEALDCFLRTKMDVLVLGPYLIERNS